MYKRKRTRQGLLHNRIIRKLTHIFLQNNGLIILRIKQTTILNNTLKLINNKPNPVINNLAVLREHQLHSTRQVNKNKLQELVIKRIIENNNNKENKSK